MKKTVVVQLIFFSIVIVATLMYGYTSSRPDGLLHIVFCDVGQGDGIYMKLPSGEDVVVDGGPNLQILSCLGNHMSFWDRTIEIVVLTHPDYDHFRGLTDVIERYDVQLLIAPAVENEASSYQDFKRVVSERNVPVRNLYEGDQLKINGIDGRVPIVIDVLWPNKLWTTQRIRNSNKYDEVLSNKVLGMASTHKNINDFSIIFTISYGLFDVLLTGDAEHSIIEKLIDSGKIASKDIELIKIPHHGAEAALTQSITNYIHPSMAVISVGKNNRYGHPHPNILSMLSRENIPFKRTDLHGDVEIISNGRTWLVEDK